MNGTHKGVGAWAFVVIDPKTDTIMSQMSGGEVGTTNNRMEYLAFINAMSTICQERKNVILDALDGKPASEIIVDEVVGFSDSNLLVQTYTTWLKKWKRSGDLNIKSNPDLLQKLLDVKNTCHQLGIVNSINWVRGHSGNKWNDYCDAMCTKEIKSIIKGKDTVLEVNSDVLIDNKLSMEERHLQHLKSMQRILSKMISEYSELISLKEKENVG